MPESLQQTLEHWANASMPSRQGEMTRSWISGFATWSTTNGCWGELADEFQRRRQVLGPKQQIVGQSELGQRGDSTAKRRPDEEIDVGLVLDDVADALEAGMADVSLQLIANVVGAEIDPADHPADEVVLVGQGQEPIGLFEDLPGLDGDRALETGRLQQRRQVGRHEIAPQHGHAIGHPDVLDRVVLPEVLMRVDVHDGAAFGIRQCDSSVSHPADYRRPDEKEKNFEAKRKYAPLKKSILVRTLRLWHVLLAFSSRSLGTRCDFGTSCND